MICRLFAAAFFPLLNIGTVYPILYLHKKALTRHKAASEPTMYLIDVPVSYTHLTLPTTSRV